MAPRLPAWSPARQSPDWFTAWDLLDDVPDDPASQQDGPKRQRRASTCGNCGDSNHNAARCDAVCAGCGEQHKKGKGTKCKGGA